MTFIIRKGSLDIYQGKDNKIIIPDEVTTINSLAFCYQNFEELIIPESVKKINSYAFKNNRLLKKLVIPKNLTDIGEHAFEGCGSLQDDKGFVIVNNILFDYFGNDKHVVIPDNVTKIGEQAFYNCKTIEKVTIPYSVTEIGKYAFSGCESLQDDKGFVIVNNILFDYYGEETNVVIPEGITKISNSSFRKCKTIKNITIPNSVTTIANSAFWSCRSLENIAISDSVTEIEKDAFYDCKKLKSMIIPINTNLQSKKKYQTQIFNNISEDLNKYINQITNVLFYLDEEIEYDDLKYKVDIPNYPRININGYENISISNEDRKNILSLLQDKCVEDERWYIPLAVFADDDTANKLINDFDIWSKGKKKDKKRLMRVKGALILNDTYTAYQYFEKIDKLKLYANKRNLTVYKLKKQLTKNNLGV